MRFDDLDIDTDFAAAVAVELAKVEAECREQGFPVSPDGAVRPPHAARLIGHKEKTLRNWRLESCTLLDRQRLRGRTVGTRKVVYPLKEIAEWRVSNTFF